VNPDLLLPIISVLIALSSLLIIVTRNKNKDIETIADRLARLETKVDVFWKDVSFDAARVLHSPHPEFARRDELLEKFMSAQLNINEAMELEAMLNEVLSKHDVESGQRMAASIVLRYLKDWYKSAETGMF
jgi:hypothetical protein